MFYVLSLTWRNIYGVSRSALAVQRFGSIAINPAAQCRMELNVTMKIRPIVRLGLQE